MHIVSVEISVIFTMVKYYSPIVNPCKRAFEEQSFSRKTLLGFSSKLTMKKEAKGSQISSYYKLIEELVSIILIYHVMYVVFCCTIFCSSDFFFLFKIWTERIWRAIHFLPKLQYKEEAESSQIVLLYINLQNSQCVFKLFGNIHMHYSSYFSDQMSCLLVYCCYLNLHAVQ